MLEESKKAGSVQIKIKINTTFYVFQVTTVSTLELMCIRHANSESNKSINKNPNRQNNCLSKDLKMSLKVTRALRNILI